MKAPETVVTQELVEKLAELLAKATSSCPETIEFGSNAHEYWLNGVTRARIEIVEATPTLLATITALQAELASARKVAGEGENVMIVASAPLKVAMGAEWAECSHVWTLYGDGGDLGGNRTEVVCRKCQCPGDYEDHAVRVVWPTT